VLPIRADFTRGFTLPDETPDGLRAIFFPGSTIGNFAPAQAGELLTRLAASTGKGGALLLGADRKKDPEMLVRAYDDSRGVTARFNLNILEVVNRDLGGDFRLDRFRHRALYDDVHGRIEMHLVSTERQEVRMAGRTFLFEEGETIHTENSYKYDRGDLESLARSGGYSIERVWSDEDELFSVLLLRA
jgi:dimethylhistidine N-methyltransferase